MKILVWGQDYHQLGERIDDGACHETGVLVKKALQIILGGGALQLRYRAWSVMKRQEGRSKWPLTSINLSNTWLGIVSHFLHSHPVDASLSHRQPDRYAFSQNVSENFQFGNRENHLSILLQSGSSLWTAISFEKLTQSHSTLTFGQLHFPTIYSNLNE